jgi:hypothetical protein
MSAHFRFLGLPLASKGSGPLKAGLAKAPSGGFGAKAAPKPIEEKILQKKRRRWSFHYQHQ